MSKEMVIILRKAGTGYIGPRWVVKSIGQRGLMGWIKRILGRSTSCEDHSINNEAPSIGVAITWDQYNTLADRLGTECSGGLRSVLFMPPPVRPKELVPNI